MKTRLETAAELIFAEVRNLNEIEEYCGYPEFTRLDAIERDKLSAMVDELLIIIHRRETYNRLS